MTLTRRFKGLVAEEGAAATELALLALILVPTLFYAIYFYELIVVKMKTQEAARYLTWELAAAQLSDWQGAKHAQKVEDLRKAVLKEVQDRWSDDQQSATPSYLPTSPGSSPLTLTVTMDSGKQNLESLPAELWSVSIANENSDNRMEISVDRMFRLAGFNTLGKLKGTVAFHVENKLTGPMMIIGDTAKKFTADSLDLTASQSLIADQWDLKQGQSVIETPQRTCTSDYCKQINRMHLFGLGDTIFGQMTSALALGVIHDPLQAVVASKVLSGGGADSSHKLDVPSGVKVHYTNTYRDTFQNNVSPYQAVYKKLGNNYLGCPEAQRQEGACDAWKR